MQKFLVRKDPPSGVGGVSTSASKAARTDGSASGIVTWKSIDNSFMARVDSRSSANVKIAAFDLDDTLQKTKSNKPGYMVTDISDFFWWDTSVKSKIDEMHASGYMVVIFSNQGGVKGALDGKRASVVRSRVDAFCKNFNFPVSFFCGTQKGPEKDPKGFRKPETGAWHYFVSMCIGDVDVDLAKSFYVGDAAGRPNDHSDSDKKFAENIGIQFFTPEEFFLEGKADGIFPSFFCVSAEEPEKKQEKEKEEVIVLSDDDQFDRKDTP